jgi:hypothetical protein
LQSCGNGKSAGHLFSVQILLKKCIIFIIISFKKLYLLVYLQRKLIFIRSIIYKGKREAGSEGWKEWEKRIDFLAKK